MQTQINGQMNAVILFIIGIPLIEIYLMIKIGGVIGAFNTIFLIFFTHRHAKKSRVFSCQSHVHKAFLRDPQNMKVYNAKALRYTKQLPILQRGTKGRHSRKYSHLHCIFYVFTYIGTR